MTTRETTEQIKENEPINPHREFIATIIGSNFGYQSKWFTNAVDLLTLAFEKEVSAKDQAYHERNLFVRYLSHIYPSHVALHPEEDKKWETDWRTIVCIHSFKGKLSWHIHDSEVDLFKHLHMQKNDWDGHTTAEKYLRLERLGNE